MEHITEGIFTGIHLAQRDNLPTQDAWIKALGFKRASKNMLDTPPTGKTRRVKAVEAFLAQQRWSATCPVCPGSAMTEYVDPNEKIFYCFNCGNADIGGDYRPVKFPDVIERLEIEADVLRRPVQNGGGTNPMSRAMMAIPHSKIQLAGRRLYYDRSWKPGIKVKQLRADTDEIKAHVKKQEASKNQAEKKAGK